MVELEMKYKEAADALEEERRRAEDNSFRLEEANILREEAETKASNLAKQLGQDPESIVSCSVNPFLQIVTIGMGCCYR